MATTTSPENSWYEQELSPSAKKAMDVECDRFEAAWKSGRPGNIERHLDAWHDPRYAAIRRRLLCELVLIDLEYRWRTSSVAPATDQPVSAGVTSRSISNGLPLRPRVEDYLMRFAELKNVGQSELELELITAEYRVRQQWGDRPTHEDYGLRFPHLQPRLEYTLRQVAIRLTPAVVRVYYHRELVFSTTLSSPLDIGRQRLGEPPPYRRLDADGTDRIIVAPLENKRVSRSHLYLDIVAKDRLKVENRSTQSSLFVNSAGRLSPGNGGYMTLPLLIFLGQTAVNVKES